jgi:galactonate dehydratase
LKVTDVTSFVVDRREKQLWQSPSSYVFVKVETDDGVVGWGEATLESKELSVVGAIQELAKNVVGQNPLDIEHHTRKWQMTSPWKGVTDSTAMSALEHAMWDIAGKAYGTPVYRLLGGPVRDRIRAYTWPHPYDTPEQCGQVAAECVEKLGFTALKFDPFRDEFFTISPQGLDYAARCMRAVREAVGDRADVAVDGHWRFGPQAAIQIARALESIGLLFFEEPCPTEHPEMLARVRAAVRVPLATGERHFSRSDVWPLLRDNLVDVLQCDVCHCGGILELRKIAAMAEPFGVTMAPHNPNGPLSLAAVVQFAACTPNFLLTESVHGRPIDDAIAPRRPRVENGYVELPTEPGLGIELDEAALLERPGAQADIWFPGKVVY